MRIWVIGRAYPSKSNGMMGNFEFEQAQMLASAGQDVTYISAVLHPFKKQTNGSYEFHEENGLKVCSFSKRFLPRLRGMYCGAARDKAWMGFLSLVEAKCGLPDVIHLHYPAMMLMANVLEAYKAKGVRIVLTEHWTKVLNKRLDAYELAQHKKYMEVADTYISVGKPLAKAALELAESDRKTEVVPNIASPLFAPVEEAHKGYRFIAVGRIEAVKQFDKLIESFARVFGDDASVSLTIVGDGKERESLVKLIEQLGIQDQVKLVGRKSREETARLVAKADCLVCCSRFETFGVPVIEAWASGIPVVCTDAAAVAKVWFEDGLGVKYAASDENGLDDALKEVFEKREEFCSEEIAAYANEHFSEEAVTKQLIDIYNR